MLASCDWDTRKLGGVADVHESIVDGDDENLASALCLRVAHVAGNMGV